MEREEDELDGLRLRVARVARRMRQRDLAQLVGVPPQRISDWETGLRRPTPQQLENLRRILEASCPSADFAEIGRASAPVSRLRDAAPKGVQKRRCEKNGRPHP